MTQITLAVLLEMRVRQSLFDRAGCFGVGSDSVMSERGHRRCSWHGAAARWWASSRNATTRER